MKKKQQIVIIAILFVLCAAAIKVEVFPMACARVNDMMSDTVTIEFNNDGFNTDTGADISPDFTQLAFFKGTQDLYVEDLKTHEVKAYSARDKIYQIKFSPDGTYLATGRDVLNVKTGQMVFLNTNAVIKDSPSFDHIAFSSDGETLAIVNDPYDPPGVHTRPITIEIWNLGTGELLQTLPAEEKVKGAISEMAFSPDGKILAVAAKQISFWDVRDGQYLKALGKKYTPEDESIRYTTDYNSVAYSPDGKYLAAVLRFNIIKQGRDPGGQEEMVEIWEIEKGTVVKKLQDPDVAQVRKVRYSPDAQSIAVGSDRGRIHPMGDAVWIWNAKSGDLSAKLTQFPDTSTISMRYSADGKYISASGFYNTKIWRLQ